MAEFTNRCFNYAQMERGPVQLNIPRDHFYGDVQVCPLLNQSINQSINQSMCRSVRYSINLVLVTLVLYSINLVLVTLVTLVLCSINLVLVTLRLQVKIPAPMGTERSAGGPESIAEAADLLAGAKVASHLYYFHSFSFPPLSVEPCHHLWWWCRHGRRCGRCCPTGRGTEGKSTFLHPHSDNSGNYSLVVVKRFHTPPNIKTFSGSSVLHIPPQ